jgi:16S rRNA C967 or C1407 C5-methylase (RsmB/RsmF family)
MANFTEIASRYEKDSVVQKSASQALLDLLDLHSGHIVLDLAAAPATGPKP